MLDIYNPPTVTHIQQPRSAKYEQQQVITINVHVDDPANPGPGTFMNWSLADVGDTRIGNCLYLCLYVGCCCSMRVYYNITLAMTSAEHHVLAMASTEHTMS